MYTIYVIHGPSCSGKSTYLSQQKGRLIELDDISNRLADQLKPVDTIIKSQVQVILNINHQDDTHITASFLPQLHKNPSFWKSLELKLNYNIRHKLVLPKYHVYLYRVIKRYINEDRIYTDKQVRMYKFMSKNHNLNLFHYSSLYFQYYFHKRHYDCIV